MTNASESIENRLELAVSACHERPSKNIASLAREFRVPCQRLRARIHGRSPRGNRAYNGNALDSSQEKARDRWIRHLDSFDSPPSLRRVEQAANQILARESDQPEQRLGKMWIYRFIKRLPQEISLVKQCTISKDRYEAEATNISLVQQFFDQLEPYVQKIPPKSIYNFDETGFRIGQGANEKVITAHPNRSASARVPV